MNETPSSLRILLVAANQTDRLLFRQAFEKSDLLCAITECTQAEESLLRLSVEPSSFDVVVIDHDLAGMSGLNLCKRLLAEKTAVPLVLMVERGSERIAVEALQGGVHDYLIKDPRRGYLDLLAVTLQRAARTHGLAHRPTEEMLRREEELWKEIFDNTATGIYRTTPEGRIIMANPALVTMLGYSSFEELSQRNLEQEGYEPSYPRSEFKERIERENKTVGLEARWKRRDGTTLIVIENARTVRDRSGKILYYEGTVEDITQHKKAEESLAESELRYRTLFETLPSGVGLASLDGRIIDANSTMLRMMGRSLEETRQINIRDTYNDPETRTRFLKQLQHQDVVRDVEVQLKRKDGAIYWASLNIAAMKMRDETVLLTVATDITERRRIGKALSESEEKYRTLVESAGDCVCVIDEEGVFLFANKQAAEDIGAQLEDLIGKTLWDFFPKEVADRRMADVRQVIKTKQGKNITRLTELKGQLFWYHTRLLPIRTDGGTRTVAMAVARNIDEVKRAEEKVRTLGCAVEQSSDGIAIADLESKLLYVNGAYARLHGYTPDAMVGMNLKDLCCKEPTSECKIAIQQIQTQGSWTGEAEHIRKDGTAFPVYISVTLLQDDSGKAAGALALCRDMTELKRQAEELTKFRTQMTRTERLASLGTLSATIAHQIVQPLTVIRLSLDNVLDELKGASSSDTAIRRLQDGISQISSITSIIDRVRNFARQSTDTRFGEVSLYAVAERVIRLLNESARQARVALRLENVGKLPPVSMSETDVEQLFFALFENAIQATDGTRARKVVVSGAVNDKRIELRFSDDCGGIAPENIDRIFEPFFTTKPRGQGTGLGLCIAQDIVARVGGQIRVESRFGKGSTFFVSLPLSEGGIS